MKLEVKLGVAIAASASFAISVPAWSQTQNSTSAQTQSRTAAQITGASRAPSQQLANNNLHHQQTLRGGVTNRDMRSFATLQSSKEYKSPLLISPYGDTVTTLVPADWMMQTGQHGPRTEETTYTPPHMAAIRAQQHNWQIMGPMSVVHTGNGELAPRVLMAQDLLHYGIPHRHSGATIMERPGYEHDMSLAAHPTPASQYMATRTTVQSQSIAEAPSRKTIQQKSRRSSIAARSRMAY